MHALISTVSTTHRLSLSIAALVTALRGEWEMWRTCIRLLKVCPANTFTEFHPGSHRLNKIIRADTMSGDAEAKAGRSKFKATPFIFEEGVVCFPEVAQVRGVRTQLGVGSLRLRSSGIVASTITC